MANLTFPSNPTNGQKVTLGDKVFVYSNTTSRWTATKLNVFGNLTGDFTIAPPELNLSNNTVAFDTAGETVYITYTVDQDVKASIANNGIANSSYANVTLHQTNNTIQITAGTEAFSGANVVLTVTNTRTSNTASISLSAAYWGFASLNPVDPSSQSGTNLFMSMSSTTYAYNNDFTIEFFYKTINHGRSNNAELYLLGTSDYQSFMFQVNGTYSEYVQFKTRPGGYGETTTNVNTTYANFRWLGSAWNHIALISTGTKFFYCINGIPAISTNINSPFSYQFNKLQLRGTYGYRLDLNPPLYSAISNLRISNKNEYSSSITNSTSTGNFSQVGYAFTPPTAPFSADSDSRFLLFGGETLGTNQGTAATSLTSGGDKWEISTTEHPFT